MKTKILDLTLCSILLIVFFGFAAIPSTLAQNNRSGAYALNPNQSVEIVDNSRSVKFDIGASAGNDDFTLRGTAKLVRKNVYEYRTIIRGKVEDSVCRIRFTFSGAYLTVKEDLECTNYRFPIVSLDGKYEKVNE